MDIGYLEGIDVKALFWSRCDVMMILLIGTVTLRIAFRVTMPKTSRRGNINFISDHKEMCH